MTSYFVITSYLFKKLMLRKYLVQISFNYPMQSVMPSCSCLNQGRENSFVRACRLECVKSLWKASEISLFSRSATQPTMVANIFEDFESASKKFLATPLSWKIPFQLQVPQTSLTPFPKARKMFYQNSKNYNPSTARVMLTRPQKFVIFLKVTLTSVVKFALLN